MFLLCQFELFLYRSLCKAVCWVSEFLEESMESCSWITEEKMLKLRGSELGRE